MANWSNPQLTSTYTNFVSEVKDRDIDLALQFDGVTASNIPTGAIRWNSSVNRWQKWSGTAWAELTSTYALTTVSATGTITGAALVPSGSSVPTVGTYLPQANTIGWSTSGLGRFFVDSSGRCLVGSSALLASPIGSATSLLQVNSTGDDAVLVAGNNFTGITVAGYRNSSSDHAIINLNGSRGTSSSPLSVASGDLLGTIRFNGRHASAFGIAANIRVIADGAPSAGIVPGAFAFDTTPSGSSTPVERLRITSSGFVLFGQTLTSTPGYFNTTVGAGLEPSNGALFLSRGDAFDVLSLNNNTASTATVVSIRRSGSVVGTITTTSGSTAYNTSSDYRLKDNVLPLTDAIYRLKQLNPVRFNFVSQPASTLDGFLAHEAQSVVPESVTGVKDEEDSLGNPIYQGIDQSKLVPLLVAALQETLERLEAVESALSS